MEMIKIDKVLLLEIFDFINDCNVANTFLKDKTKTLATRLEKIITSEVIKNDNFISECSCRKEQKQDTRNI